MSSRLTRPRSKPPSKSLAEAGIEERPEELLADAGYANEENLAALDDDDPDCYVATRNIKNNPHRAPDSTGRFAVMLPSSSTWTARSRARLAGRCT